MEAGQGRARLSRRGFTLVELLVAMAIIALLLGVMIKVAETVRTNAEIKNTEATMQMLTAALEEYQRYQQERGVNEADVFPRDPYEGAFENSCQPWEQDAMLWCWEAHGLGAGDFDWGLHETYSDWEGTDADPARGAMASVEVLYWYMSDVPASGGVLSKLSAKVTGNDDRDAVTAGGQQKTLIEVNDAWGHPIRYQRQAAGNFPELRSAGPDGVFENSDDIVSGEL